MRLRPIPGSGGSGVALVSQSSSALVALHKDGVIGYSLIMASRVRSKPKSPTFSGPPRVRYEPPTIEEAVAAAQDLAADPEQQVTIAAGLMGMPEDQVRSQVLSAVPKRAFSRPARDWAQPTRSPQVVVVQRRRVGPE